MKKYLEYTLIKNEYCQEELLEATNKLKPNDFIFKINKLKEQISQQKYILNESSKDKFKKLDIKLDLIALQNALLSNLFLELGTK
jgi:hypothetical protein